MRSAILRRLYGWNEPPADAAADAAELFAEPEQRLARGAVEFGPVRTTPALLLLVAVFSLVVWAVVDTLVERRRLDVEFVALSVALAAMSLYAVLRLKSMRHGRMILDGNGVEFRNRQTVIFCPWSLFNAGGGPLLDGTLPHILHLPINPAAVPDVTLSRANRAPRTGTDVVLIEFKFGEQDSLKLGLLYAVDALTIANLLLHLGRHFAKNPATDMGPVVESPRSAPVPNPPARSPAAAATWVGGSEAVAVDRNNWVTVDAVRAQLPPMCCVCGQTTSETYRLPCKTRHLGFFEGSPAKISIPCCNPCQWTIYSRRKMGNRLILGICVLLGMFVLMMALGAAEFVDSVLKFHSGVLSGWFVTTVLLLGIFWRFGDELFSPVYLRYQSRAKTFSFWFRQPGYAEQVRAYVRDPDGWKHPAADDRTSGSKA